MLDSTPTRRHPNLPFGGFYGRLDRRRHAPGMDIALLDVDPHRVVERHSHDEAHFVFVLDGLYASKAAGAPALSAGRALIFNPAGTTHRDRFEARERVMGGQFLTISVASDLVQAAQQEAGVAPQAIALKAAGALALAERLTTELGHEGVDAALTHESLVLALLAEVATQRAREWRDAPAWLTIARERLDDALGEEIRMAEIASVAGVHPVHLARVFRQFVGMTPADYLRQRRLACARTLLRETRRPIAEIALACGFVDQSHFTTAFRRACRQTPGAFRSG
ncbi:helix-turn-helix domain-containing protein [Ideonella sp.]|uniref:helix-turn-helix transcriptional regulator n=1 Tax=Ideonella sp. TaxID=1929293 RepID=UPI003BB526E4